ncbi:c-type cytochrome [Aliarcobacter trophiarum]|uniref:Cytochrome c domain-containing protein n=1 Tax=Aliarcobacter trophiarum LMG 25534 TaxID=1032241 RepID=A0AAD0QKZ8_9BACT|nr:c-type cytochrome [Aliarcobacter trophiarum]AXK49589.1 hypothetical protein ATR_1766 [Aliarcobacter trophiarum LMG 25534]
MRKIIVACALLSGTYLLADTTMCFKENHPSMSTIESVPLEGGACGGKFSINDMKKKGWLVDDIKINGSSYIYILKTQDHGKAIAGVAPSGISQEQMEANIIAKLEAKQEAEEEALIIKENQAMLSEARDLYTTQCQSCHGEKGDKTKGDSKLKNLSQKDMEQALKDYELGISEEKRSSIYGPAHINYLNNKSIKGIKTYLDSIQ